MIGSGGFKKTSEAEAAEPQSLSDGNTIQFWRGPAIQAHQYEGTHDRTGTTRHRDPHGPGNWEVNAMCAVNKIFEPNRPGARSNDSRRHRQSQHKAAALLYTGHIFLEFKFKFVTALYHDVCLLPQQARAIELQIYLRLASETFL